MIIAE